jgi:hypothetical protein
MPLRRPPEKRGGNQHMPLSKQLFTPTEVEALQANDRSAATALISLMSGIFTLGLIGYLGVCFWVG